MVLQLPLTCWLVPPNKDSRGLSHFLSIHCLHFHLLQYPLLICSWPMFFMHYTLPIRSLPTFSPFVLSTSHQSLFTFLPLKLFAKSRKLRSRTLVSLKLRTIVKMQDATTLNTKCIYHKNQLKFSPQLRLDDLSFLLFLVFFLPYLLCYGISKGDLGIIHKAYIRGQLRIY